MIELKRNANFGRVAVWGNIDPCTICGRPCKNPKWSVLLVRPEYLEYAATEKELAQLRKKIKEENFGFGYVAIGSDCLRKHSELKPYVVRNH